MEYRSMRASFVWLLALLILALATDTNISAEEQARFNVLFIAVDDLRPELACYGHPTVKSPHIDRLAASGTLFTRAYCQQAVCNPSRASLMTGLRPETLGVTDLPTHFRDQRPDAVSVAQYFRQNGYTSRRVGKIFHTGHGNRDDTLSWSKVESFRRAPRYGPAGTAHLQKLLQQARVAGVDTRNNRTRPRGLPWEAPDVADDQLADGSIARRALALLREHQHESFFLAVGFLNPHLPFVAPKKYWDLYERNTIPLADNPEPPQDSPKFAWTNWGELRKYYGIPASGPLTEHQAREAIHGYWAATSYVDALVGQLLDELDRLQLRQKTVVILWGDHGWQLGEHGFWCKHTNYEVAARVPLIISIPGQQNPGSRCDRLVEFVDIFPTLTESCELPAPSGLDGISFLPLVDDPERPWKKAAFHLYPRTIPGHGPAIGRAIRTERYRLVEWAAKKSDYRAYEFYDLQQDPDENVNLAGAEESQATIKQLTRQLHAGWPKALPEASAQ
jgi:arylsulfatase A-like enzyme